MALEKESRERSCEAETDLDCPGPKGYELRIVVVRPLYIYEELVIDA